ncbi:hypothetical protein P7K49_032528 [Saguinus oedipus]|uniref:Uncharacterized protein n=1 Tax=Saguinus oedipus TaxID=9490 RepID=A0ABQ9TYH5_SAGOE|nr:hypothetical protein P7K49_032528 [Saguinus oedipus]
MSAWCKLTEFTQEMESIIQALAQKLVGRSPCWRPAQASGGQVRAGKTRVGTHAEAALFLPNERILTHKGQARNCLDLTAWLLGTDRECTMAPANAGFPTGSQGANLLATSL